MNYKEREKKKKGYDFVKWVDKVTKDFFLPINVGLEY